MKILITGASGFIGSHLAEKLIQMGEIVYSFVRKTSNVENLEKLGSNLIYGDMRDLESLKKAVMGIDIVIHCAAIASDWGPKKLFWETNVRGTINLIDACVDVDVKRIVYIGSVSVYGMIAHNGTTEETPVRRYSSAYSQSKIEDEKVLLKAYEDKGLPVVCLRVPMVYGPRSYTFIMQVVERIKKGELILFDNGENVAGLIYIDNLIDAIILAIYKEKIDGEVFLVSDDDHETTWKVFFNTIAHMIRIPPIEKSVPFWMAYVIGFAMEYWGKIIRSKESPKLTRTKARIFGSQRDFNISKIKKTLGYKPNVQFQDGMKKVKEWLVEEEII